LADQPLEHELQCRLGIENVQILEAAEKEIEFAVLGDKLPEIAAVLKERGAYLVTMAGVDERQVTRNFGIYSVFMLPPENTLIKIRISADPDKPDYPALTPLFPSAHWLEREMRDLLGITPKGHPDLRRLAVHHDWPQGVYPLRKDFAAGTEVRRQPGEMKFTLVEGEGIYQIPVGPIHAGIIEPGHFRFFAFGEDVINLQAQLFYTHRGVEKAAEGKSFPEATLVAERVCGVCSASHAVAYAQAVESMAAVEIPARAKYIRTIMLEMERLYNHVGDIGNMCAGIGFAFGISRGAILKEQLMRLNLQLTGHRYLRGMVVPGGVKKDLSAPVTFTPFAQIQKELNGITAAMLSSQGLLDRMQNTGILSREAAVALGAVGPAARASGVKRDVRKELPYAAYPELDFAVPCQEKGDVFCRLMQRIEECEQSFAILRQAIAKLPRGDLSVEIPEIPVYRTALGITESARGANVHWVMSGPGNSIYAYRVRSASHCNWPVLPLCLPGNIVPDFPLINKSFELCYACLDR